MWLNTRDNFFEKDAFWATQISKFLSHVSLRLISCQQFSLKWISMLHSQEWKLYSWFIPKVFKIAPYRPGSLIGNTWNQFWSFWSPKNCHFYHMNSSEIWFLSYFWHFQVSNLRKKKIQSLQNCWNDSFWPSKISLNWFHVKSDWQENG